MTLLAEHILKRDKRPHGEQAAAVGEEMAAKYGFDLHANPQTHYVNTSQEEDADGKPTGRLIVHVHKVDP